MNFDLFPSLCVIILPEHHNVQLHNLRNKQNLVWKDTVHNEAFGAVSGGSSMVIWGCAVGRDPA